MTDLTPQQTAFISTAKRDPTKVAQSVALRARAGTGKTFSLREWANASSKGGVATSFSKSTVVELSKKLTGKFPAKTLHGIGYRTIQTSGKFTELAKDKIYSITQRFCENADISYEVQPHIRTLVAIAKTYGIQPDLLGPPGLIEDEYQVWEFLAEQFDIEFTDEIYTASREVLLLSNQAAIKQGIIDFDDMLYISLLWPHRFPRFPIVLGDEVQDWSSLQHGMVKRLLLPGGRVIAAGDDRQAIYAFRGALADSYTKLVQTFDMLELPLTVSFRCPKAVVWEAQRYVPDIEPAPGAIEGAVLEPSSISLDDLPRTVLCRNNAPLIALALSLLVSGHTVEVAGQDIGKGLVNLTKRITKRNLKSDEFKARLEAWKDREIAKHPRRKGRVNDKYLALVALANHHRDLKAIQEHLLSLYPDPSSRSYKQPEFHLTTIHRSKGREWPRVLFLDPQLLPSEYAKQAHELVQEDNLAYVGITRAQEELVYCPSASIEGLEKD